MTLSLGEHLARAARRTPEGVALVEGDKLTTYAELHERTNRLVTGLTSLGVAAEDRVAVLMSNAAEPIEAFAASMKAGWTHVPLNARLLEHEIASALENSGARVLLSDPEHADAARAAAASVPGTRVLVSGPGPDSLDAIRASGSSDLSHFAGPDQGGLLIYTSGTTGHAKGVWTTPGSIVRYALSVLVPEYRITPTSRILNLYPHSSTASTSNCFVPAWVTGSTLVIDDVRHFTAERFLANVERHRVTHATAVPTMLVRILRHLEEHGVQHDLSSLHTVAYGSAPIAPDVTRRLIGFLGPVLMQVYGMTETNGFVTTLRHEEHDPSTDAGRALLASCGAAVPAADVEVVDTDGVPVPPRTQGEIRMRSDFVMRGYWQDDERTAATLRDGWVHSGDIGYLDESGFVYVVDRMKDLIISGGQNIASKEVEDVLYAHTDVVEAAVIGVPDDEWGERVTAFLVLRDGVEPDRAVAEVEAICSERLAPFKRPRGYRLLDELPKNSVGKISKVDLRARANT